MISLDTFEKICLKRLIEERKSDDADELRKYIKEPESQKILKQFYEEGVGRFKRNPAHDNKIAFEYCINTAVENLSLLF